MEWGCPRIFWKFEGIDDNSPASNYTIFFQIVLIESDASGFDFGVVLMQEEQSVVYYSQTLSDKAWAKSVYEWERMAIVLSIRKLRHYLLGRKFLIRTDQQSLKFLLD